MELLLNLVWASISLSLVVCWFRSARSSRAKLEWGLVIALALLIVLLFPAISMTDDLVAMNAPAELEHMLRRSEAPLTHTTSVSWLDAVTAILVMCIISSASPGIYFSRIYLRAFATALRTAFVRTLGVRPPPAPALLAV